VGKEGSAPFAPVLGTMKDGIEKLTGTEGASDRGWTEPNSYDRKSKGNVMISFKDSPATAHLRSFLLHTMSSCRELYRTCRNLGLPETSVQTKMPWYRCCLSPSEPMFCSAWIHSHAFDTCTPAPAFQGLLSEACMSMQP